MNNSGFTDFGSSMQQFWLTPYTQHANYGDKHLFLHEVISNPFLYASFTQTSFYHLFNIWNSNNSYNALKATLEERKEMDQVRRDQALEQMDEEISTMREEQRKNIQHLREMNKKTYEHQREQDEFRFFLNEIKDFFSRSNDSVMQLHLEEEKLQKFRLMVMVLRSPDLNSIFDKYDSKTDYYNFCKVVGDSLPDEYFITKNIEISNEISRGLVTDTMCIHYMMQGLPSLIIYPRKDGNSFVLDYAMWGYRPGTENIFFKRNAFCFEYNGDQRQLVDGILTLTMIMNDASRLFICGEQTFLTKDCTAFKEHPAVRDFTEHFSKCLNNTIIKTVFS